MTPAQVWAELLGRPNVFWRWITGRYDVWPSQPDPEEVQVQVHIASRRLAEGV